MQEYIVTCRSYEDLQSLYDDMETEGGALYIPDRAVELLNRREVSRNTHYNLTEEEAALVAQDERVIACELLPELRGLTPKRMTFIPRNPYTKSGDFTKDSDTNNTTEQNYNQWGFLHSAGTTSQRRKGSSSTPRYDWPWVNNSSVSEEANDSVEIFDSGKNVDIVVVDGSAGFDSDEWKSPTTGSTRFVQYDWYAEHTNISGGGNYSYPPVSAADDHGMHVTGTCGGLYYGWANEANLYNIDFEIVSASTLFDYIREFHRTKPLGPNGIKNATICNNSWGYFYANATVEDILWSNLIEIVWNGVTYNAGNPNPSGWTLEGVGVDFGFENNKQYGVRVSSIDADIADAIAEGVVMIGSAGNSDQYIARPEDPEYSAVMTFTGAGTIDVTKGSSPSAANGVICVGALSDYYTRADFSNFGPRIDVWAPGVNIVSVGGDGTYASPTPLYGPITRPEYTSGVDSILTFSGTSMAGPQVAGIAACVASGKDRVSNDDIIGFIRNLSRDNDIDFDLYNSPAGNFYNVNIDVSSTNPNWVADGNDLTGTVNQGNNPTFTFETGDTVNITMPSGDHYAQITGQQNSADYFFQYSDRTGTYTTNQADPDFFMEEGDTLTLEFGVTLGSHPLIITDQSGTVLTEGGGLVTGQYSNTAGQAVYFTPPVGTTGTFKYRCSSHPNMEGDIIVAAAGTYFADGLTIRKNGPTQPDIDSAQIVSGTLGSNKGTIQWAIPADPSAAGTYYYVSNVNNTMFGEFVVNARAGLLGQAGNKLDNSCQQGSPNREVFCDNPRNKSSWKGGWKKDTLNSRRLTDPVDTGDRQLYPRPNTFTRG